MFITVSNKRSATTISRNFGKTITCAFNQATVVLEIAADAFVIVALIVTSQTDVDVITRSPSYNILKTLYKINYTSVSKIEK